MNLLIIEDERPLADALQKGLGEEGYVVHCAYDGESGFEAAASGSFDLVLLDWRLPGRSGESVVRTLRDNGHSVPVLMLTALGQLHHRVTGLEAGADDYLVKPFAFEELLARIRALLRRAGELRTGEQIVAGSLRIDPLARDARIHNRSVYLRNKEYLMLETLARRPGRVFSRTLLCEKVWGTGYAVSDNTIDVTVSGLRARLADCRADAGPTASVPSIETVRGMGYRLNVS